VAWWSEEEVAVQGDGQAQLELDELVTVVIVPKIPTNLLICNEQNPTATVLS
jgi:hypothetical protein